RGRRRRARARRGGRAGRARRRPAQRPRRPRALLVRVPRQPPPTRAHGPRGLSCRPPLLPARPRRRAPAGARGARRRAARGPRARRRARRPRRALPRPLPRRARRARGGGGRPPAPRARGRDRRGGRSHRGGRHPDRARRRARRRAGGEGRPRLLRGLRRGHVVGRGAPAPLSGGTMDETVNSRILGLGHHLPERVVTNQDLTRLMDTSEEWIEQRTGIRERRFISADMGGADLGERAAREALREAGIAAGDLDLVILGSLSPDIDFPGTASLLQRKLGVRGMPVMDVRNQCSGFVYMLAVADAWIRSGDARYVLVVGAEIHSTGLDLSTLGREAAVIFGDGAGAAVLGPEPDRRRGI